MTTSERRKEILDVLSSQRHEKIENLAFTFQVTRRTIERDILALTLEYPIYTTKGTGGGVHVMDGRYIYDAHRMNVEQTELLERLSKELSGKDAEIMKTILKKYGK